MEQCWWSVPFRGISDWLARSRDDLSSSTVWRLTSPLRLLSPPSPAVAKNHDAMSQSDTESMASPATVFQRDLDVAERQFRVLADRRTGVGGRTPSTLLVKRHFCGGSSAVHPTASPWGEGRRGGQRRGRLPHPGRSLRPGA